MAENIRERQLAAIEATAKRARYAMFLYAAALIATGVIISVLTPLMGRLMEHGN